MIWGIYTGKEVNPIRFNRAFIGGVVEISRQLVESRCGVVMVVGGGKIARLRIGDAKSYGDPSIDEQLDHVGLSASNTNAAELLAILQREGIGGYWYSREKWGEMEPGSVWVRGGTEPGHTTDYVTVQAALAEGIDHVINIGNTPGLHPLDDQGFDQSRVIEGITATKFLDMFNSTEHESGMSRPFEPKAAEMAATYGITVILVGGDKENLQRLMNGEDFTGTVMRPE
jgi:uridylate kinase